MFNLRASFALAALAAAVLGYGHLAVADTVSADMLASPVTAADSLHPAVPDNPLTEGAASYHRDTGYVDFFIPVNSSKSGVYGVTNVGSGKTAGTTSDLGRGTGFGGDPALSMFLHFPSPRPSAPVVTADVAFTFDDLDLDGAGDTSWFFEAVRVRDAAGDAITPLIETLGQGSTPADPYPFSTSGNRDGQTLTLNGLGDMVGNDGLALQVDFFSRSTHPSRLRNTAESMKAVMSIEQTTNTQPIPEPASLVVAASGLALVFGRRRRR